MMNLVSGQSKEEKKFLEDIKQKNATRTRLPRGQYIKKSK